MIINSEILYNILGKNFEENIHFENLGWANTNIPNSLTFIDDERYIYELAKNPNIKGVLTTKEIAESINGQLKIIVSEDPRWDYYTIYNYLAKSLYKEVPSIISPYAHIHRTAFVSEWNVVIGKNSVIGPNVSILSDVKIGQDSIIRAGSVIGTEGFEYKRTSKGILPVFHDGGVVIGNNVDIGGNTVIDKGFAHRHTIIGDDTKIDNLVHVAHGAQIGKRCLLPASCLIAGSTTLEDDVWIGPNASISSQLVVGKGAYVTIGSVVTKNVEPNSKVTGNFAIPHHKFLKNLRNDLKDN